MSRLLFSLESDSSIDDYYSIIDFVSYLSGEWFLVSVPNSCENRSFLTGDGDNKYSGWFLRGVNVARSDVGILSKKGDGKSLIRISSIFLCELLNIFWGVLRWI